MTTPREELPAPTSTTAPTPPKPPRRKRSEESAKPDGASKAEAPADGGTKVDETVASTTDAPAPPKRGRRGAGAASASAAGAPSVAKVAPVKPDAAPVTARTAPRLPDPRPPTVFPTIATSEADADAVLVDQTPAPQRQAGRDSVITSAPTSAPTVVGTGRTSAVRVERQFRQTVTKVDLWSVTKLALCFYLSSMFVTVVAFVALWLIASAAGIVHSVEKFLGDLLSAKNFHFLSATVLRGAILVGLVVVALQVVITVIGASFYNIFAELFGGIEITVREEGPSE